MECINTYRIVTVAKRVDVALNVSDHRMVSMEIELALVAKPDDTIGEAYAPSWN